MATYKPKIDTDKEQKKVSNLLKDFYKLDGVNVSPREVENKISTEPTETIYELTQKALDMADAIMNSKGTQNMMGNPIMSSVFKKNPKRKTETEPEQQDSKTKVNQNKKDPNITTVSSGSVAPLKVGDSISNVFGKMYNFMLKEYEYDSKVFEENQKYNKKLAEVKEERILELIGLFGEKEKIARQAPPKEKPKTPAKEALKPKAKEALKPKAKEAPKPTAKEVPKPTAKEAPKPTAKEVPKPTAKEAPKLTSKVTIGAAGAAAGVGALLMPTESIAAVINKASDIVGVDKSLMYAMAKQESGFDPSAAAKTSSAKGLYQFIKGTWNSMVKQYGSKYPILKEKGPEDAEANALAGALFIKENSDYLSKNGIPVNATTIYAAHFLGPKGAKKLLTADPETDAAALMPDAAASNDFIFYEKTNNKPDKSKPRTVQQVTNVLFEKVGQYQEKYKQKLKLSDRGSEQELQSQVEPVPKQSPQIPDKLPTNNGKQNSSTTILQQNKTTNINHGGTTYAAPQESTAQPALLAAQYR
jgi:hypothetical protein